MRGSSGAGVGGEPAVTARTAATAAPAQFVRRVRLPAEASTGRYPFTLPAVAWLAASTEGLELPGGADVSGRRERHGHLHPD